MSKKRMKVMTVVGTRPELIRLSRIVAVLDRHTSHTLVHTGQNYDYELSDVFFEDLGIPRPDHYLGAAGPDAATTIGNTIIKFDAVLAQNRPEALVVLGDTNSCLAVIPAKRRHIPIFHLEAGNRCFDQRVPEEINRKIVDHVSDINLTYSRIAREYLLREGILPDRVITIGSPMREVIEHYRDKIDASPVLADRKLNPLDYFVVSAHREENVDSDESFEKLVAVINSVAEEHHKEILVSTHPRTQGRIDETGIKFRNEVTLSAPLAFTDYVHLQQHAIAVLSDSGTVTEESSILNFPAVNIREAHERPEGMEEAAVMMTGLSATRVLQALEILRHQPRGKDRLLHRVSDYSPDRVSEKVLRIVLSYTDFVRRTVWGEPV
jgi:UDP-N-acetylglucosamine 2-epimerase